ncbi:hypothetical protein EON65_06645 [archaeon]|nr:MAG: hypothetical protein EON65_06645 [archaeon]
MLRARHGSRIGEDRGWFRIPLSLFGGYLVQRRRQRQEGLALIGSVGPPNRKRKGVLSIEALGEGSKIKKYQSVGFFLAFSASSAAFCASSSAFHQLND